MLLEGKNAVIYVAGGAIGGAVARAFTREGAKAFLAGRTLAKLEQVAADISAAGGAVEVALLDAMDEHAVDSHADAIAAKAGRLDIAPVSTAVRQAISERSTCVMFSRLVSATIIRLGTSNAPTL